MKFVESMGMKMTKIKQITFILLLIILTSALTSCKSDLKTGLDPSEVPPVPNGMSGIINPDSEVRGVWIASVFNIDYPSTNSLTADKLKAEIDDIINTCEANRLNTIYFQVRPACDALYKSDVFPVSRYLSSDGKLTFDPLEYIVSEAHKKNIFVHAWINPLRVTVNSSETIESLPDKSPAKAHPEWTVEYAGKIYFNAGIPEVRNLIADGAREILNGYDVDGIVYDDYFYPYPATGDDGTRLVFDDKEEYEKYGSSFGSVEDFRRDNINKLIELTYNTVKEADGERLFGVSPCGVWQNDDGVNGGSETRGFEGYKEIYCDALAWIKGGYIDYISPQLYWRFSTEGTKYDSLVRWWNAALEESDVDLVISHGVYRYEEGDWQDPAGEMKEQVEFARSELSYKGSVFYGYDEIKKNVAGVSSEFTELYKDDIIYTDPESTGSGVVVSSPENGTTLTSEYTYIIGESDPVEPLYMNGKAVGRTKGGFFSLYVKLEKGENKFVFSHKDEEYTYTVYRETAGLKNNINQSDGTSNGTSNGTFLDEFKIVNAFPKEKAITSNDVISVYCSAPEGAVVTASIGGVKTELKAEPLADGTKSGRKGGDGKGKYRAVKYAGEIKLTSDGDSADSASRVGAIVFRAVKDASLVEETGADVYVMDKDDDKLAVKAIKDRCALKLSRNSSYYNDFAPQAVGMTDYAVEMYDGFYKLRMGGYISEADVEETSDFPSESSTLESVSVENGGEFSDIIIRISDNVPYDAQVADGKFIVTLYNTDAGTAPEPAIQKNPIISGFEMIKSSDESKIRYQFNLNDEENYYGFSSAYNEKGLVISLKNPSMIDASSERPLSGIKIAVDAGHGGEEPGARGAESGGKNGVFEKDVNLDIALECAEKLSKLGAEVVLTRDCDKTFYLKDRAEYLGDVNPDLSISIHQNSMDYGVDVTKVRGTLSLWYAPSGRLLSEYVGLSAARNLGRAFICKRQELAMCRNPAFPQTLIETGFMSSVEEYDSLVNRDGIIKAADGIANGVLRYFERQGEYLRIYGE